MRRGILILLVVIALAVGFVSTVFFTVSEREYAIVTRFGRLTQTITEPGLYTKWGSLTDRVTRIDKRLAVFQTRPIELLLGDQNPIILTCYVCWEVERPVNFFRSLMNVENANVKLRDMVQSSLGSVLSNYTLQDMINTEDDAVRLWEIEARTQKDFASKASEKYGIAVRDLGIRRVAYPPVVTQAVHNRMRSEREKEAKLYRGQGREEAAKIEAETDKQVAEILANANREAEATRGQADAEVTKIYAETYSKDPEFFEFLQSLETYEEILAKGATLVLSTKSRLFRYLTPEEGLHAPTSRPSREKAAR